MELIASKFVSVADMLELGYTIPTGIQLINKNGYIAGYYLKHVKDEHQDCHILRDETFRCSRPFLTQEVGIMIKVAFEKGIIDMHLAALKYS